MIKSEGRITEIRPETLEVYSQGWMVPTGDEIRAVKSMTEKTGVQLGGILGVHGRTIRKWIGNETKIPYSAWRILIYSAGLVTEVV